eukprot:CAMPEP_0176494486 /NCGR_PEP_ID=MMETSP0200_2-20121128/10129_1 /TAXON_ID=947934 /ORGANISM="Chaetoceros sp., Strain GSL56" /LENGTH=437 /DNA_ID=CAMNT_0017892261 /DNA_START=14 /DNA_END=1325 /DNA_ORIENTATION=+
MTFRTFKNLLNIVLVVISYTDAFQSVHSPVLRVRVRKLILDAQTSNSGSDDTDTTSSFKVGETHSTPTVTTDSEYSRRRFLLSSSSTAIGIWTAMTMFSSASAVASTSTAMGEITTADNTKTETIKSSSTKATGTTMSSSITNTASASATTPTIQQIVQQSAQKAISGGKAGATASVVQVFSLMWLRTSMNYQYRYGGTLTSSLKTLYTEGGVGRLYQGLPFALVQGPLTRFGDTAANVGILALLNSIPEMEALPLPVKTACGSICAGLWRIVLMPVDTSKTVMQVEGSKGLEELFRNVGENGVGPLYRGALASAAATAVGHFPWFLTYNFLNDALPPTLFVDIVGGGGADVSGGGMENLVLVKLVRSAVLGFSASCVSDVCSNSLRVVKTTKQTAGLNEKGQEISYKDTLDMILEKDGWTGLFGRGLSTRLLTNAI